MIIHAGNEKQLPRQESQGNHQNLYSLLNTEPTQRSEGCLISSFSFSYQSVLFKGIIPTFIFDMVYSTILSRVNAISKGFEQGPVLVALHI